MSLAEYVKTELDTFEAYKAKQLVPTLQKAPVISNDITDEEKRRRKAEQQRQLLLEQHLGRGGSTTSTLLKIGGKDFTTFPKLMELGLSRVAKWLSNLQKLRSNELLATIRQHCLLTDIIPVRKLKTNPESNKATKQQRKMSQPDVTLVKEYVCTISDPNYVKLLNLWKKYCKLSSTLVMPNATVSFYSFLLELLPPNSVYVDKKEVEQLYAMINDNRSFPLDISPAFLKFILLFTDVENCSLEVMQFYTKLFFSVCYHTLQPMDFINVVDFQFMVSTFEELVFHQSTASPFHSILEPMIETFKKDIIFNYSVKQPIGLHIHVKDALELFPTSSFVKMLRQTESCERFVVQLGCGAEGENEGEVDGKGLFDVLIKSESSVLLEGANSM